LIIKQEAACCSSQPHEASEFGIKLPSQSAIAPSQPENYQKKIKNNLP
jgi:hypothetical protein